MARTAGWSRWWRWGLGALGVGFATVAYVYLTIPDVRVLATRDPETTAFIDLRRDEAHDAGKSFTLRRRWVPYNRIAAQLKRAVIVAEDSGFFEHEGLDYEQIRESIEDSLVICSGDLKVSKISNSLVIVKGAVTIAKDVMSSTIHAGGHLKIGTTLEDSTLLAIGGLEATGKAKNNWFVNTADVKIKANDSPRLAKRGRLPGGR